jgi:VIT1/CCC1 family predicted Fe2+/Mn2+ transporter
VATEHAELPRPVTALGRRFASSPSDEPSGRAQPRLGRRDHRHEGDRDWLRDVILGGKTVLLAAGFAAAITESISMGAVGYTSAVADRDYYKAQRAIEKAAVVEDTDLECREVTELYRSKGFSGELLDQVVATITANRERWVETIMNEERHLSPVSSKEVFGTSVVITIATLIGHLIPLLPFVFLDRTESLVLGLILSAVTLFGVGAYQAITRVGRWWLLGSRMIAIGLGAAGIGFAIGRLFHASGA